MYYISAVKLFINLVY